jgi:hypothetical protein
MENRNDLINDYAEFVVGGMDMDTLVWYAFDAIRERQSAYNDEELLEEIARVSPEWLDIPQPREDAEEAVGPN